MKIIFKYFLILLLALNFYTTFAQTFNRDKYKRTVYEFESKHAGGYKAYNKSSGCAGKYQLMYKYIPKKYNGGSLKSFLNNPKLQEDAMEWYIVKSIPYAKIIQKKVGIEFIEAMLYLHWQGIYANGSNYRKYKSEIKKRYKFYLSI